MANYYPNNEDNLYERINLFVPKGIAEIIRKQLEERGGTVSRFYSIALDNEISSKTPFCYDTEVPVKKDEQNLYLKECRQIIEVLAKAATGISLEVLVLCRHNFGISDKDVFLTAISDLIAGNQAELFKYRSKQTGIFENRLRLKDAVMNYVKTNKKYKKIEEEDTRWQHTIKDEEVGE